MPNLLPVLAVLLATAMVAPAAVHAAEKSAATPAAQRHPLRGVITAVLPAQSAFMIKHEAIPGVMRAMTMMFKVDEATLKVFKTGDAITGLMSRQDRYWILEEVKSAAPLPAK